MTSFSVRRLLEDKSFNFIPIVVISEIVFIFTLLNFLQTAFTDPGVLQKGNILVYKLQNVFSNDISPFLSSPCLQSPQG